tara:strand:- start:323 stop:502 length:180 start_codon:yes stop_codon:yes gene_type:complete
MNDEPMESAVASSMLDEIKMWFKDFCSEPKINGSEEINSLYDWFEGYHKRQGFDTDYKT